MTGVSISTVSTDTATSPKSTKSRNSDSSSDSDYKQTMTENPSWPFPLIKLHPRNRETQNPQKTQITNKPWRSVHSAVSTGKAPSPKSIRSKNSDSSVSHGTIFKLRFWFNLNLYLDIWVSESSGFRRCHIFSGFQSCNVHTENPIQCTNVMAHAWIVTVYTQMSHVTHLGDVAGTNGSGQSLWHTHINSHGKRTDEPCRMSHVTHLGDVANKHGSG